MSEIPPQYSEYPRQVSAPRIRMETIGEAWQWLRAEMGLWALAAFLVMLITVLLAVPFYVLAILPLIGNREPGFGQLLAFYAWSFPAVIMAFVGQAIGFAGMYNMALKQIQGESISIRDFFDYKGAFLHHVLVGVVISFAVLIGSMACYLPGFMIGGLLLFTQPIIVHQRIGGFAALSQSWNMMKGQLWMATAFYFILSLVAGLGSIACIVGVLFTYPLYPLAVSLVYRDHLSALYGQTAQEA